MALGLTIGGNGGGEDILPFCKFDARSGRMFRNDRAENNGQFESTPVDVTNNFKAVFDLENIEIGYMMFASGSAPQFLLARLGDPMPHKPADANWKQGVRLMLKLHASCGGDVRELSGNSASLLKGIDDLHTAYEAGKATNAGKLPIVVLKSAMPVTTGSGAKKSTNYQPVFEIVGWTSRPTDLVHVSKVAGKRTELPPNTLAPATGSTQVAPPPAKQMATADNDFG